MERKPLSKLRKLYILKLIARCLIFLSGILLYLTHPEQFTVIYGMNFFREFSILHLLWVVWMVDMVCQLIPKNFHIPLGSQKHLAFRFRPGKQPLCKAELKQYIAAANKRAGFVFLLWVLLTVALGLLHRGGYLAREIMVLISMCFFVCDLICVLIWCPFRLMLGNRCCTTCRIFNWDHLMMFAHLSFTGGFYCLSLFFMSLTVFLVWEINLFRHPERFWDRTNAALRCSECTDKLCTQFCPKPKKK